MEDESLSAALGQRVLVKVETLNPIRSFKGRGADFLVQSLDPAVQIICASAGNFGQAIAYAGRRRGMRVEVFVANDVNPFKKERMESFGAVVTKAGADFDVAKKSARAAAASRPGCIFVEDGAEDAIAEGAGTIGIELLRAGEMDTIVVPLGDGALITGVAAWMKAKSPRTRIVGVCASGAPSMLESVRRGDVVSSHAATIADGIAVSAPIPKSVARVAQLVDEIVAVDDAAMLDAMRLAALTLGLLLEPAGAAGLAAIRAHSIPGDRLATILTGSNIHPALLPELLGT